MRCDVRCYADLTMLFCDVLCCARLCFTMLYHTAAWCGVVCCGVLCCGVAWFHVVCTGFLEADTLNVGLDFAVPREALKKEHFRRKKPALVGDAPQNAWVFDNGTHVLLCGKCRVL